MSLLRREQVRLVRSLEYGGDKLSATVSVHCQNCSAQWNSLAILEEAFKGIKAEAGKTVLDTLAEQFCNEAMEYATP